MKNCRKCNEEKKLNDFPKHKSNKDGYDSMCKICTNEYSKQRRLKNIDKERERYKRYNESNKQTRELSKLIEKKCIQCNQTKTIKNFSAHMTNKDGYNNKCKLCISNYYEEYRKKNINYELTRSKKYYEKNKDKKKEYQNKNKEIILERNKKYYEKNKNIISEKRKKWYQSNKETIIEKGKKYYKNRILTDPIFKLKRDIKLLIRDAFRRKDISKGSLRTIDILGCSVEEFRQYIESKFEPWMNWENKGLYNGTECYGWDIDHITPINTSETLDDVVRLNHHSNLQPLCSYHNRVIKRANIN